MRHLLLVVLLLAATHGKAQPSDSGIDPAVAADPASLDALRDYIYEKPPLDLVDLARTVVALRGFTAQDSEDPLGFDTGWKKDSKGGQVRYHVVIFAISTEKAQAKFILQHQSTERADPDLAASWTLLKKADPEGAKELATQAPPLSKPHPKPSGKPSGKPSPTAKPKHTPIPTPQPAQSPDDQQ